LIEVLLLDVDLGNLEQGPSSQVLACGLVGKRRQEVLNDAPLRVGKMLGRLV